jgi:hypothetical protein
MPHRKRFATTGSRRGGRLLTLMSTRHLVLAQAGAGLDVDVVAPGGCHCAGGKLALPVLAMLALSWRDPTATPPRQRSAGRSSTVGSARGWAGDQEPQLVSPLDPVTLAAVA